MKRAGRQNSHSNSHSFGTVIGVIDLMAGLAVRGFSGKRDAYRPLDCCLTNGGDATQLARRYRGLGVRSIYVADLDAITTGVPQDELLVKVAQYSDRIFVDAAVNSVARFVSLCRSFREIKASIVFVVGLESLESLADLHGLIESEKDNDVSLAFSLDLKAGQPLTTVPEWSEARPSQIVAEVINMGLNRFIVLDLASVGTGEGCPTLELCQEIRNRFPDVELITGGGIRDTQEIERLAPICDGLLLGSLLYDGKFVP